MSKEDGIREPVRVRHVKVSKLDFDNVSSHIILRTHATQRVLEEQRDFLSRLGVVEQRVALLVDKRRRI